MNCKKFFTVLVISTLCAFSYAQDTKITYSNITEFGLQTASPRWVALEATTVNGFAIDKQHALGIGIGMGGMFKIYGNNSYAFPYMPFYLNYRMYFRPGKTFSPHVNLAFGGIMTTENYGGYSAITVGFRAGKFSFASGVSFFPHNYDYGWQYPVGLTLKVGFSFE